MSGTYGELHFDQFGRVEMDHVYQVAQSLLLSCVREGEKGGRGSDTVLGVAVSDRKARDGEKALQSAAVWGKGGLTSRGPDAL